MAQPDHIRNFEGQGVTTTRLDNASLSGKGEKFNGAIFEHKGKRYIAYRRYDPERFLKSNPANNTMNIAVSELGQDWKPTGHHITIVFPRRHGDERYEDCRMFTFRGDLYMVCAEVLIAGSWTCSQALFKLNPDTFQIEHIIRIPVGNNYKPKFAEKNWTFFEHGEGEQSKLMLLYNVGEMQIHEVHHHTGQVLGGSIGNKLYWPFGYMRGGTTPIKLPDGTWLKFVHSSSDHAWSAMGGMRRYSMSAIIFEDKPPFKVLRVSKDPILYGSRHEAWIGHGNSQCVFPAGTIMEGDTWHVSGGVNDTYNAIWHLDSRKVLAAMVDAAHFFKPQLMYFFSRNPKAVTHIVGAENKFVITKAGGRGLEGVIATADPFAIGELQTDPNSITITEEDYNERITVARTGKPGIVFQPTILPIKL